MQTSVSNYFWLVDRLNMDDNPSNKVNVQTESVTLCDSLQNEIRSGELIQKLIGQMHVTYIKRTEKPFTLKTIGAKSDKERWNGLFNQLQSFGVDLDANAQGKLLGGDDRQIDQLITDLFDIDNSPQTNLKEVNRSQDLESLRSIIDQSTDVASRFSQPLVSKNMLKNGSGTQVRKSKATLDPIDS